MSIERVEASSGVQLILRNEHARNALTTHMVVALRPFFISPPAAVQCIVLRGHAQGGAFCAGGDVKSVVLARKKNDRSVGVGFFEEEAQLISAVAHCSLPVVSVWDGAVFGGGLGISLPGAYRIATQKTRLAMPESAIGFFVDCGVTLHFATLGAVGMFLALTGDSIGPQDALHFAFATHYVDASRVDAMCDALCSQTAPNQKSSLTVERILRQFSCPPPLDALFDRSVRRWQKEIEACFGADKKDVESILRELGEPSPNGDAATLWRKSVRDALLSKSPLSLEVSFALVRYSKGKPLDTVLEKCLTIDRHMLDEPDFLEGVRAVLIDKTKDSAWAKEVQDELRSRVRSWIEETDATVLSRSTDAGYGTRERQIYNHWQDMADFCCYGCSPDTGLKLALFVDGKSGDVVCDHFVTAKSFPSVAHGGLVALLVDEVAYFAALRKQTTGRKFGVTRGLQMRYERPVRPDWVEIRASAEIVASATKVTVHILQGTARCAVGTVEYVFPEDDKLIKQIMAPMKHEKFKSFFVAERFSR